ncbi:MAG: hypothetical protein ACOC4J_02345, partial [Bacteroidota bacterium]
NTIHNQNTSNPNCTMLELKFTLPMLPSVTPVPQLYHAGIEIICNGNISNLQILPQLYHAGIEIRLAPLRLCEK